MNELRDRIEAELTDATTELQRQVAITRARAKIVAESWDAYDGKDEAGVAVFHHGRRTVTIAAVEYAEHDGTACIEVWTAPKNGSPPAFRIINPPLLASDPAGIIEIHTPRARLRYRGDPLAALVNVIGSRG